MQPSASLKAGAQFANSEINFLTNATSQLSTGYDK
jgi:hypothetical protein